MTRRKIEATTEANGKKEGDRMVVSVAAPSG